ncbi:TPA: phosphatase PAP2 family protein [Candidatus Woesearchaeota archaeon]|nr:phosphatase PAP2 family protein [Candidatus Woesearchaeota archaeon]
MDSGNRGVDLFLNMAQLIPTIVDKFFKDISPLGGGVLYSLVLLVVLGLQEMALFLRLLFGFLLTGMVVVLIRSVYFKDRPQRREYHSWMEKIIASSFPSWHTARAVFLALTFMTLGGVYLKVVLGFIALLVGYSRIHLRRHDYWDVLGGMVLGMVTFFLGSFFF